MRSAKSIPSSLDNNNHHIINNYHRNQQQMANNPQTSPGSQVSNWTNGGATKVNKAMQQQAAAGPTSPICRCRVMYLGSSVPLITKDGLQGIQEPLRKLYPDQVSLDSGSAGIDSWLSVWSNGILIENVDENGREMKRFFKIGALHYCAAVKYIPNQQTMNMHHHHQQAMYSSSTLPNNPSAMMQHQQQQNAAAASLPRFLPLDSPYARQTDSSPPIFASILRRTTGIKVLECHAFICKREAAANALVRCCFHAYADTMYAKQIGADVHSLTNCDTNADNSGTSFQETEHDFGAPTQSSSDNQHQHHHHHHHQQQQQQDNHHSNHNSNHSEQPTTNRLAARSRSKSIAALNEHQDMESSHRSNKINTDNHATNPGTGADPDYCSLADNQPHLLDSHSMDGRKSSLVEAQYHQQTRDELDWNGNHLANGGGVCGTNNLKKHQQKQLSKSMHYLNYQNGGGAGGPLPPLPPPMNGSGNYATTAAMLLNDAFQSMTINPTSSNGNFPNQWPKQSPSSNQQQQPFYNNPYAMRVPSYPAQEQIDSANGGGTLKSIRSMAANSIASTLLRSKRHAKSMAQLNKDKIISFHQPHPHQQLQHHHTIGSAHTMMGPPVMLPPVPPMFLPNLPHGGMINGSQTMKLPSRSMVPMMGGQPVNFEAMTTKEMKKLLKKSAKYGIPIENGLPPPSMLPPLPRQHHHQSSHLMTPAHNGDGTGTLPLRPPSIYSDMFNNGGGYGADISPDMAASLHAHGLPLPPLPATIEHHQQQQQMTPILVKPNQEFLKSKAGKKWLKQQKEFKKLLPPHLDGLPIIFGPPPPDALKPTGLPVHPPPPPPPSIGRNIPACDSIENRNRIYY